MTARTRYRAGDQVVVFSLNSCIPYPKRLVVRVYGEGVIIDKQVGCPLGLINGPVHPLERLFLEYPKIKLITGQIVYGCECWFGAPSSMRRRYDDRYWVAADIEEDRKSYAKDGRWL